MTPQVFQVLLSLSDAPRHGYAMIQDIDDRTGGEIRLTASTLYDALARLVDSGLIAEVPPPTASGGGAPRASERSPREESDSGSAAARASGGGAPRASKKSPREESDSGSAAARASGGGAPRASKEDSRRRYYALTREGRDAAATEARRLERTLTMAREKKIIG